MAFSDQSSASSIEDAIEDESELQVEFHSEDEATEELLSPQESDSQHEDDLAQWQQRVFERPQEGLTHLAMLATGGFDALIVLNLQCNQIDDVTPIVFAAASLRLLNLSGNAIASLPLGSADFWSRFQSLSLLFLGDNGLTSWEDLEGLQQCRRLMWLTLEGNPVMARGHARSFLVNKLPMLQACNEYVITDVEYITTDASRSLRFFAACSPALHIPAHLRMPLEFGDDASALRYVADTEHMLSQMRARYSPSITLQRMVRGHLSRRHRSLPLPRVRNLIVRVQKHVRGFLLRRRVYHEWVALVTAQGKQDLLLVGAVNAPFLTNSAQRGLRQLLALIHAWRARYHAKKQGIAIKKIRFWCQLVRQRQRYRCAHLMRREQELFIYYTASEEQELLALAAKAARRDPVLRLLSPNEREEMLRQRCSTSGVSVIRQPSKERVLTTQRQPLAPTRAPHEQRSEKAVVATLAPALVRVFHEHHALETQVLVRQKQLLVQDRALLQRLAVEEPAHATASERRAMQLQITHLLIEIDKRLIGCNKKLRRACLHEQQEQLLLRQIGGAQHSSVTTSLCHVRIRSRGFAPTRSERRKINALAARQNALSVEDATGTGTNEPAAHAPRLQYPHMRVFFPFSIDMYLFLTAALQQASLKRIHGGFVLCYQDCRELQAAVVIQSAWRAALATCSRDALEVTITRALVCLQRWWRSCRGLRRRLSFLRACVLLGASIHSRTLFMETYVYHVVSSVATWPRVDGILRPAPEHDLRCTVVDGAVSVSLSPAQSMLHRSAMELALDPIAVMSNATSYGSRCGYFPLWMPGVPPQCDESMSSRDVDATPLLLDDRVAVEPTLLERELLVHVNQAQDDAFASTSPYRGFTSAHRVYRAAADIMAMSKRLSQLRHPQPQYDSSHALATTLFVGEPTAFVRLTFATVEEARHRALVLLAKTYDPVTHSYARLYSIESLVGAVLWRHQWAVSKLSSELDPDPDRERSVDPHSKTVNDAAAVDNDGHQDTHHSVNNGQRVLNECRRWLQAEFPSRWAVYVQSQLPDTVGIQLAIPSAPHTPMTPTPSSGRHGSIPSHRSYRCASSGEVAMLPRRPMVPGAEYARDTPPMGPAPLHLAEAVADSDGHGKGIQPVPPPIGSAAAMSASSRGTSRHRIFTDRLGQSEAPTVQDQRESYLEDLEYHVRDLREERERAMEALIVDRRLIQREHAAELAGIHLEMNVKLQRLKYEHELTKLGTRELIELNKMNETHRKLTRQFETGFVAQTGAMMRRAARHTVEKKLIKKEEIRHEQVTQIREQAKHAKTRRQDTKSYWFLNNKRTKQEVQSAVEEGLANVQVKKDTRLRLVRQRIGEDKEIKKALRLI